MKSNKNLPIYYKKVIEHGGIRLCLLDMVASSARLSLGIVQAASVLKK